MNGMINSDKIFMVMDVESIGLHGDGFAVGYVVVDRFLKKLDQGMFSCRRSEANGTDKDREWVDVNIPDLGANCRTQLEVRDRFWYEWMKWKSKGAILCADCPWPVEARFLAKCIDDDVTRIWDGPYPLIDVASCMLAVGVNPIQQFGRQPDQLPVHNPLCDARQSAGLLIAAMDKYDTTRGGAKP